MRLLDRLDLGAAGRPSGRELRWLAVIAALGLALRVVVVILDRHHMLAGDEVTYNRYGTFAEHGRWLWTSEPFGIPHASYWKMPLYPLVVGAAYNLGLHHHGLELAQTVLGPVMVGLTWLLARRLFGSVRIALAAAAVIAVYPFAWQYQVRLFPEAVAVPLILGLMVVGLDRTPTLRRAAALGVLTGLAILARPNAFVFLAALAVGWIADVGLRRSIGLGVVAGACTLLVLVPWTLRNHRLTGDYQALSVQDAAIYGTFNSAAANDPKQPYAWRAFPPGVRVLLRHPVDDGEFKRRLRQLGTDYIKDHPESVPKALYWNSFRRAWELRRPGDVLDTAQDAGAGRGATLAGLIMYWLMLPLALLALWRLRHRRALLLTVIAAVLALAASEISVAATRYRGPLEPLIVVLACAGALGARRGVPDPAP